MKPSPEAGLRWLRQAEHDLDIAEKHQAGEDYSDACFMAEQASQKALKGFLTAHGRRSIPIHSAAQLAEECSHIDKDFSSHIDPARILDQYYIPTRYPDALAPPAVPFESYTKEQGAKAVQAAKAIVFACRTKTARSQKTLTLVSVHALSTNHSFPSAQSLLFAPHVVS